MSTNQTAYVCIKNNFNGEALIQMSHRYSGSAPDVATWIVAPGATTAPLTINYKTGAGTGFDYWYCSASVMSGSDAGIYATSGSLLNPTKECMLESSDAGKTITNSVNKSTFNISLPSGACSTSMNRLADHARITNIFVLMLENHSFDHLFGFSGFNNISGLTGNESNTFSGITYKTSHPAVIPCRPAPDTNF